jgi:hypothetical protein
MEAELRRNGCDTGSAGSAEFMEVESAMGDPRTQSAGAPPPGGVSFEPGKPMIDPTRR